MSNNEETKSQVKEFIEIMEKDYGISMDEAKDALKYYKRISRYSGIFANAIVAGLAAGFLYTIWAGVFYVITNLKNIINH